MQKRTVDRVGGHQTLEINRDFDNRGRHVDASRASNQHRTGDKHGIVGPWPTIIARSRPSIGLHRMERSAIFAKNSLINIHVLPLYLKFWSDLEEIKCF